MGRFIVYKIERKMWKKEFIEVEDFPDVLYDKAEKFAREYTKKYWYRNYRMSKSTDKKLKAVKKKMGKSWNETFKELIELYNNK